MTELDPQRRTVLAWCTLPALLVAGCAGGAAVKPQDDLGALLKAGQELYAAKRFDEAIAKFRELIARDGNQWQAHLWLARAFIGKVAWSDAIAAARRAHELSASGQDVVAVFAEALFGGGADALRTSNFKTAIGHFTDYIKVQPSNARAYLNVGRAFIGDKRFGDALSAILKGLTVAAGPERAELLKSLQEGGLQALAQGEFAGAIGFLREYLKLDPANIRAYIDLAKSFIGNNDYASALATFVQGLGQGGQRNEVLQAMAEAGKQALASGKAREAVGFLREYVRQDSGNLNAYLDLAKSYWQSGERLNALDAFRRVLQINPRQEEALRFLRGG